MVVTFVLIPKSEINLHFKPMEINQKMIIQDSQCESLLHADCIWQPPRTI